VRSVRGAQDIDCPVDLVFDALADRRNEPIFNPHMTTSTKVTPGPIGVGIRFAATVMSCGTPRRS
jgi:hypothetical protein